LVLAGALGTAAVEGGSHLGVKSAGATSESKSSANEDENGSVGSKKLQNNSVEKFSDLEKNSPKQNSTENKSGTKDVTGENLEKITSYLKNELGDYSYVVEPREDKDGNLYVDLNIEVGDPVEIKDSGLKLIVNKDGTFTIQPISDRDEPITVNSIENLGKELLHRGMFKTAWEEYEKGNYTADELSKFAEEWNIKLTNMPVLNSVRSGETMVATAENQEELKRKAAELFDDNN
jgi:hypothetical protein